MNLTIYTLGLCNTLCSPVIQVYEQLISPFGIRTSLWNQLEVNGDKLRQIV